MARGGEDRGRGDGSSGAWAAAAVVLALGGLGFGVVAQMRASDAADRLDRLEAVVREQSAPAGAAGPTTTGPGRDVPTTLGREPESPDEARAGVMHAFEVAYDGTKPIEERVAFVDDATGVADAIAATTTGQYAAQVARSRARIDDVTFTSAVGANVRYAVAASGAPALDGRVGAARVVGGTWKVTRETICADLAEVGASCDA